MPNDAIQGFAVDHAAALECDTMTPCSFNSAYSFLSIDSSPIAMSATRLNSDTEVVGSQAVVARISSALSVT